MFLSAVYAQESGVDSVMAHSSSPVTAEHGSNFPPFDATYFGSHLFWLALSFAIFYFLMARFVIPQIGSIVEMRRLRIAGDLETAAKLKQESDATMQLYEQQLEEVRSNAHNLARTAIDDAKALSDKERMTTEDAIAKQLAEAEKQINRLHTRAMSHVEKISLETAQIIITSLIGHKIDSDIVVRAVELTARD